MSNTWFTSDLHLAHRMVAALRGYDDLDDYHAHLVDTWNAHVRPSDTVWNLGDVTLGPVEQVAEVLRSLNGTQHLVAGNHDRCSPMFRQAHSQQRRWLEHFASVHAFARRRMHKTDVLLSHFPYRGEGSRDIPDRHTQYRLPNEGLPLVHGHTHDPEQRLTHDRGTPMLHVGWDAWQRPVSLHEVETLLCVVA